MIGKEMYERRSTSSRSAAGPWNPRDAWSMLPGARVVGTCRAVHAGLERGSDVQPGWHDPSDGPALRRSALSGLFAAPGRMDGALVLPATGAAMGSLDLGDLLVFAGGGRVQTQNALLRHLALTATWRRSLSRKIEGWKSRLSRVGSRLSRRPEPGSFPPRARRSFRRACTSWDVPASRSCAEARSA